MGDANNGVISPSAIRFRCDEPEKVVGNLFNLTEYECFRSFFNETLNSADDVRLTPAVGYVVVITFGLFFALFTVALIYIDHYVRGASRRGNSEFFNTAGRETPAGLTATVLVSQWTWAATLLQSSNVAFRYGIAGPFWYASGASIQILLFSLLAILVKLRAPTTHTFLEIVRARWGRTSHIIFICFALVTNTVVTTMLILGGSAVTAALTGMSKFLASFLIPLGVIMYTLAGGLKATFIASWMNTTTIMIIMLVLVFKVWASSPELGSPQQVWERLRFVQDFFPVKDNRDGSYLTILSRDALFFGLINVVGNFGTVFVDQAFWQSAIAATPSSAWTGHMLGGLAWFAIPFTMATALGLGAVALSLPVSETEANAGLVAPATAVHLMGRHGAVAMLIMVFSAVTSSGAAEMIAVSSIISYDVYRTYINPTCSGSRIIFVSRVSILCYGFLMGLVGIVFNTIDIDLSFLYSAMAVFISPALCPIIYSISWGRASARGANIGALSGLVAGVSVWLAYGSTFDGGLTKENLDHVEVHLVGALTSILVSFVVCTGLSFYDPDDCDWSTTRAITLIEDDPNSRLTFETEAELRGAFRKNVIIAVSISISILVVWPLLTVPASTFSLPYFKLWVYISLLWGIASAIILICLPLWESRSGIISVASLGYIKPKPGKITDAFGDDESDDFVADER